MFISITGMNDVLVIIPTFDEKENVRSIADAVLGLGCDVDILFVDDNSPDGTGQVIDEMREGDERIHVLHKKEKKGLGRAYVAGFRWALERHYQFVMEMDADFSHDPKEILNFLKAAEDADLVLGSRYVDGIRITNWPLSRLALSKGASLYVRLVTGMPITDPTGGYKCFRRAVLEALDFDTIVANGYAFQIEVTHAAWRMGFRIEEIPITFEDRRSGYSKMESWICSEAFWMVWRLAFRGRRRGRKKEESTDNAVQGDVTE
jgi:dolichol-phosphate mannosyltransferase